MATKIMALITTIILFTTHSFTQGGILYYGSDSNSLRVSFVDTSLSYKNKAAIITDLQLCLRDWGKVTTLDLEGCEPGWTGYLDNPSKSPHYPPVNKFPKQVVMNDANELNLLVTKSLSDAYTNSFAFAAANPNVVTAAYQFVSFISSPEFINIPHKDLPNYLYIRDTTATQIVNKAARFITDLQHQTYYPPSLLGFFYSDTGPAATNLLMLVPCSSPSGDGGLEWDPFAAIWHDNRWKLFFWYEKNK